MMRLREKRALITGGTSGIGLAIASLFQAEGARVAVTGREAAGLVRARERLGNEALVLESDAGKVAALPALMRHVQEQFGGLDVLVLNAGVSGALPIAQVSEA
ncbi:MAG TPA: SDR family NAD(P)-dependent oxidoreductase, partial [Moraxellaceae bacterium]|nr:SDR family NAD(P)-dependent oxidoreductase [Moraxellaceae bacterium]